MAHGTKATYDTEATGEHYTFRFAQPDDAALRMLREQYALDAEVSSSSADLDKLERICTWVSQRWQHDGSNEPSSFDALTILREAVAGKQFRCVEFSIVLSACMNALGLPSRVLSLRTRDCQTRETGAGHVVSEVFLPDVQRWVLADAQWNAVLTGPDGTLSAYGLREALDERADVRSSQLSASTLREYLTWIDEYLFYFDVQFDTREFEKFPEARLMLVPLGAPEPTVFQRRFPITGAIYTHSVPTFYPSPS